MHALPQTRQSLLIELGKYSDGAWVEFLQIYENAIMAYCRTMGLQEADALDATQEVMAAVHGRISTWDSDPARGSFRAWLFRVARNVAVDMIVARARRSSTNATTRIEQALEDAPDPREQHEATLERAYQHALLEWGANQVRLEVREATWLAFELTAIHGQRAEDVAERLGMTVGSVYTAKCRVIARLRTKVSQFDGTLANPQERAGRSGHVPYPETQR